MADIFREIDEEIRRDKASKVWEQYRTPILAVAALIVAAAGAWRAYEYYAVKQAEEAGAKYEQALQLAREGKSKEAESTLEEIARTGPPGYAMLAKFREASETAAADPDGAVRIYDALASDAAVSQPLRDLAALRAAILRMPKADAGEMQRRLEPLAQAGKAYRNTAREMLAVAAFKRDDLEAAGKWLDMIVVDAQSPPSIRQRAEALLGLVTGGRKSTATPPQPAPAPAQQSAPAPQSAPTPDAGAPAGQTAPVQPAPQPEPGPGTAPDAQAPAASTPQ